MGRSALSEDTVVQSGAAGRRNTAAATERFPHVALSIDVFLRINALPGFVAQPAQLIDAVQRRRIDSLAHHGRQSF